MHYNILEARIEFENKQLKRITVLVDMSANDFRAFYATTKTAFGYFSIRPDATISEELLQEVARSGMETVDRDEIFPKWKIKYLNQKPKHASI